MERQRDLCRRDSVKLSHIQGPSVQSPDQDTSDNGRRRNVSAKQTNLRKPKLARSKLLGFPQLQTCMAREELVERPLQPRRFRIRWMVCLECRILDPGLGLRSQCILRL